MEVICLNKIVDFTNCKKLLGRAYNGANGKKIAVEYAGEQYMLKFPPSGDRKPTNLSYTNSCISEHIASSVFNLIGIETQETILGTYNVGNKNKIVCACKDFTSGGKHFFDFCSIKNTILDSDSAGSGTELDDIIDTIEKQEYVDPLELKEHFWNVFIADAFLGNFDRHNGNWGFLFDDEKQKAEIAPIYDCGSCLLPQADEKVMKDVIFDKDALNARIYQFPTSAIKINGKKINYYDFLSNTDNRYCISALNKIVKNINLEEINQFIDTVPLITDLQKQFYKTYLEARYEKILCHSLDIALSDEFNSELQINL